MCGGNKLLDGCATGAHLEGKADGWHKFGIGFPTVDDARGAVAVGANGDGFAAPESPGRRAGHGAVLFHHLAKSAGYVDGDFDRGLFGGP
ncbi:MAG: hypothetical protein HY865_00840 [Chloroflexi bacterium]|nr:hypothetical protein [Chloroflexota bacterium]